LLATPLTYYLVSDWLANFAYRITVTPLLFLIGGLIALTITLLTISYHTLRAARENPVKSLRYE
jgi:putative ABC transport system permease protein